MWEFCLQFRAENAGLANEFYLSIKKFSAAKGGVVTLAEQQGYTGILIGCDDGLRTDYENCLCKLITQVICTQYKDNFLSQSLILPHHDRMGLLAFKKALLNFDRETDYYIIARALSFKKTLYFESFYDFKLASLKSKWAELVCLANENRDYLISTDSFLDLLKFLVDNLDICEEEVDIVQEKDGYKLYLPSGSEEKINKISNDEGLISSIIDLSPQKINLYCQKDNSVANLLEKIFAARIKVTNIGVGAIERLNK